MIDRQSLPMSLLLSNTNPGHQLYTVGDDTESAHRIGIRVGLIHIFATAGAAQWWRLAGWYSSIAQAPNALPGGKRDVLKAREW